MNTLAAAFKSETIRLARQAIKQAVSPLLTTIRKQRHTIAKLKEQIAALTKETTKQAAPTVPGVSDKEVKKARFSGRLIRRLRTKLGLSRDQFGKLVGVTGYAVIAWECGDNGPNIQRKKAIVALRKMGKREIRQMVEAGKTVVE